MADRTSAGLFGKIFELLAKNPTEEHKKIALEIWPLQSDYDFNQYQMYADDSLKTLGLAKLGVDPRYPQDGETLMYANENGEFEV